MLMAVMGQYWWKRVGFRLDWFVSAGKQCDTALFEFRQKRKCEVLFDRMPPNRAANYMLHFKTNR